MVDVSLWKLFGASKLKILSYKSLFGHCFGLVNTCGRKINAKNPSVISLHT